VVVYYFYDMRPEGKPDIPLGTDFDEALKQWDQLHNNAPRIVGTLQEAFDAWERDELPKYTNKHTLKGYRKGLARLRPAFGPATWDVVDLPTLKGYLKARSGKTQGNREIALLSLIWNWSRGEGYTTLPWPAAGMEKARWKNKEGVRRVKVLDPVYEAIYAEGDQVLRDCMDLSSATGMRLTDCVNVLLPRDDVLHLEASKTGKEAEWDLSLSDVLPELLARRRAIKARHLMLLSRADGMRVSLSMLRDRWDAARMQARIKASLANEEELYRAIKGQWLRDMRKAAAQRAESLEQAAQLLQHESTRTTQRHYGAVSRLKTVR
jgi:hypothetical protein